MTYSRKLDIQDDLVFVRAAVGHVERKLGAVPQEASRTS